LEFTPTFTGCMLSVTMHEAACLFMAPRRAQLESRAQEYSVDVLHKPVRPAILRKGLLGLLEHCPR